MSNINMAHLTVGAPDVLVSADPNMLIAWESIDRWTGTAEAAALMRRYTPGIGVVPTSGRVGSPGVITAKDLSTLMPQQWLNDNVVDAYLALVCHTANGHFQEGELPVTPRWFAWNTFTLATLKAHGNVVARQWPPALYPQAAVEDVEYHIFPICERSHWFLGLALRNSQCWRVMYLSSKAGYQGDFEEAWRYFANYLAVLSNQRLDLRQAQITGPAHQPMQNNGNDCGVFLLAQVRWLAEGWDTRDLVPNRISDIRYRMIYEIENWNLHAE